MNAMSLAPELARIVGGAGWFPDQFDARQVRYLEASREQLAQATFLDHRFTGQFKSIAAPTPDVRAMLARLPKPQAPAIIFHTAFCASTLLARALDVPGRVRALKEPYLLVRAAEAFRRDGGADLVLASRLLSQACGEERALAKPSNATNMLAPQLMSAAPQSRALILHSDLRSFLVAVLTAREDRKTFVRRLFQMFGENHPFVRQLDQCDLLLLPDIKMAAFAWRLQVEPLFAALNSAPERAASLNMRALSARPAETLSAVAQWLELGLEDVDFAAVAAGPVFAGHAKNVGHRYDADAQHAERRRIEEMFAWELDAACAWAAEKLPFGGGDDGRFPNPLAV